MGDVVEVSRHLVGPLSWLSVVIVVVIAIGIDSAIVLVGGVAVEPAVAEDERAWSMQDGPEATAATQSARWVRPVVIAVFGALALIAMLHMQLSTANYDPQYMAVRVERMIRLGG